MPFNEDTFLLLSQCCTDPFDSPDHLHCVLKRCFLCFLTCFCDFKMFTVLLFDFCKGCFTSFVLFLTEREVSGSFSLNKSLQHSLAFFLRVKFLCLQSRYLETHQQRFIRGIIINTRLFVFLNHFVYMCSSF